jgi:hypothetical protein
MSILLTLKLYLCNPVIRGENSEYMNNKKEKEEQE